MFHQFHRLHFPKGGLQTSVIRSRRQPGQRNRNRFIPRLEQALERRSAQLLAQHIVKLDFYVCLFIHCKGDYGAGANRVWGGGCVRHNIRHSDGYYWPKLYWVSKQTPSVTASGNQVTYLPSVGDIQITGVERAKAYSVGAIDPTTGLPTVTLDYVPMLSTTALSAPGAGDLPSGAVASGYYGELPLFLSWTSQSAVTAVLGSLEGQEAAGVFQPGNLNLTTFLGSPVMTGFQPSSSFPTL